MTRRIRLASYNIEWFNQLFDKHDQPALDGRWSRRRDVTRKAQGDAIARVIRRIDADLIAVIEAPDSSVRRKRSAGRALIHFARHHDLRLRSALDGFESGTEQEIALWFDPALVEARHAPLGEKLTQARAAASLESATGPAPRFDGAFALDLDGDGDLDWHVFSKPPLEAQITLNGAPLRMIAAHLKSKAPHGARDADHAALIALENRRKQLAQCAWLRLRVEEHLDRKDDLIVLGDFNDGPGQDKYERRFGRSGVELVRGDGLAPERHLANPYLHPRWVAPYGERPATARFYNPIRKGWVNALLDFIMLSPALAARTAPQWRIWHPFDDADCYRDKALREALLTASDHFPVTVDMEL